MRHLGKFLVCILAAGLGLFCGEEIFVGVAHTLSETEVGPQRAQLVVLSLRGIVFWVDPKQPEQIAGAVVPKGLAQSDTLVSIATRPANGQVYARSRFGSLYKIDLKTGAARQAGRVSVAFGGVTYEAAAFSPVCDRMRVVTDIRTNYLFNPRTGAGEPDVELATKGIVASIAYSPPVGRVTTLFGIDRVRRELVQIETNNVRAIGPLGVPAGPLQGLAIEQDGRAYAALAFGDLGTKLYGVNLETGAAREIGMLGSGGLVRGIAAL